MQSPQPAEAPDESETVGSSLPGFPPSDDVQAVANRRAESNASRVVTRNVVILG